MDRKISWFKYFKQLKYSHYVQEMQMLGLILFITVAFHWKFAKKTACDTFKW